MDPFPNYSVLLNEKLVVPSSTTQYVAIDQHFFYQLMRDFISKIYVDVPWYIGSNPDIEEAIANGLSAKDHYCRFGYFEHRMPYAIKVEEEWYLDAYPDIKEAVEQRAFPSGQSHFDVIGYREGRIPAPGFSLRTELTDD